MMSLSPARLHTTEQDHLSYTVRLPRATKFEECLDEKFWTNVAMILKPWDHIEILPDDFSYHAELVVIATDRLWAKVGLLSYMDIVIATAVAADDLRVQWAGPSAKYRVLRGTTVLQDGFVTKPEAEQWKLEHVKPAKAA